MGTVAVDAATPTRQPSQGSPSGLSRFRCERWYRRFVVLTCIAFAPAYALVGHLLGQDVDWDLINYHFFDPFWVLSNHMQDIAPAYLQTYYNPLVDIPFYLAARSQPAWMVGAGIALIQSLSFPLVYVIARNFVRSRPLCLMLAALGMFTSGAVMEIGFDMGDTIVAPFFLASVALGIRAVRVSGVEPVTVGSRTERRRSRVGPVAFWPIASAGAVAGVGAGLKLSAIPLAIGAVVAFVGISGSIVRRVRAGLMAAAGLLAGLVVSYGWWGYEMTARFGNPIFPYLNQVFRSRYAPLVSGTDPTGKPHGLGELLVYPFVWTADPPRVGIAGFRELTGPLLEAMLVLLVVKSIVGAVRQRAWPPLFGSDPERYLVTFAVVSYFVWVSVFGLYRYFIAVEMLAWILIIVIGRRLIGDLLPKRAMAVLFAVALVVVLGTERVGLLPRPWWSPRYFTVAIPPALRDHRAAFLLFDSNPEGYLIPFFPSQDFFGRIQDTISSTVPVQEQIKRQLTRYHTVYALWTDPLTGYSSDAQLVESRDWLWHHYGFNVEPDSCVHFSASVGPVGQGVHVCRLTRITPRG
jgi:hypothetical protein